ncbi:MAG: hypothetical protein Q8L48_36120 [Archangium sp.]|nr:hypothetical protein [Archangium sp.]
MNKLFGRRLGKRPALLVLLLAACATTSKAPARPVTCEIDIELVTPAFIGTASSPNDSRKTLSDARQAACDALHVSSPQTDCDDPLQVVETTRTIFPARGGVVTQTAEVRLRKVVNLIHKRAEGSVSAHPSRREFADPLELCRSATTTLCASVPDGLTCYQEGVECNPIDDNSTRCAPVERERVRPLMERRR